ncbi:MAG TPA: DUF2243 domain-containing protein [Leptolyngbyaceae cyanobacterium]
MAAEQTRKGILAGILIGVGMGGFVDGIVLHQILQWHNMISNVLPPETVENMSINMVWDGIFHAFDWVATLIGIFLLWSAAYHRDPIPSLQQFVGTLVFGMGAFNLIEGIIDHHILSLHYVRQVPNYTLYNFTFLAIGGVLFILIGWVLMNSKKVTVEN